MENINRGKTGWHVHGLKLTWSSHNITSLHTQLVREESCLDKGLQAACSANTPVEEEEPLGWKTVVNKRIECRQFPLFHTASRNKVLVLHHMTIVQNYTRHQQIKVTWQVTVTFSSDHECPSPPVMKGETGCRGRWILEQLIQTTVDSYQHQRILWDTHVSSCATTTSYRVRKELWSFYLMGPE